MNLYQICQQHGLEPRLIDERGRLRDPARADAEETEWLLAVETMEIAAAEATLGDFFDLARRQAIGRAMPTSWDVGAI